MVCDGADACRKAVREQLCVRDRLGQDLREHGRAPADGRRLRRLPPNWTKEEIEAVVSEAHAHRVKVAAHARSDTGLRIALAAGVDSIEHGDSIRPKPRPRWRAGHLSLPTLHVGRLRVRAAGRRRLRHLGEMPEIHRKSFENCRQAGVKIAFGTDAGGFPGPRRTRRRSSRSRCALGMYADRGHPQRHVAAADLLGMTGQVGRVADGRVRRPGRRRRAIRSPTSACWRTSTSS